MKKVKPGDLVVIDGVAYQFGPTSAFEYNAYIEYNERFGPFLGKEKDPIIHLWVAGQYSGEGEPFLFSKVKEALERRVE